MSSSVPQAKVGGPRAVLAMSSVYADGHLTKRGTGTDHVFQMVFQDNQPPADTVIMKFWNDPNNKAIVDAFMNNKLCIDAAHGKPEAIEAYKRYAVQDYFYLIDWFKFRVLRLATLPHSDLALDNLSKELNSVHSSLGDVTEWLKTCIQPESEGGLGLSMEDFHVERTIGEVAYGQFLQNNARETEWYNLHIILIGCYWAWSKLGVKLYNDPDTKKDTIFYKNWILPNVDTSSGTAELASFAKALSQFLDDNAAANTSAISNAEATDLFRSALRLEVGLFNSAYDTPMPTRAPFPRFPGFPIEHPGPVLGGPHNRAGDWEKLLGL